MLLTFFLGSQGFFRLHSLRSAAVFTRSSIFRPLEDDPHLRDKIENEKDKLSKYAVKDIRDELRSLGIPSSSYHERADLIKLLAETRVVNFLRHKQEHKQQIRAQSETAKRIVDEIEEIRLQPWENVRRELNEYGLPSVGLTREEAIRSLALARLEIIAKDVSVDEKVREDYLESVISVFDNVSNVLQQSGQKIVETFSNGKDTVKSVAGSYERRGFTTSEQEALKIIKTGVEIPLSRKEVSKKPSSESLKAPIKINDIDSGILSSLADFFGTRVRLVFDVLTYDALLLLLNSGLNAARRAGAWAGGQALTASQSLLIACSICISFRRGILTFLGTLLTVRLIRIAFSAGLQQGSGSKDDDTISTQ